MRTTTIPASPTPAGLPLTWPWLRDRLMPMDGIAAFCRKLRIGRSTFYRHEQNGDEGPRLTVAQYVCLLDEAGCTVHGPDGQPMLLRPRNDTPLAPAMAPARVLQNT